MNKSEFIDKLSETLSYSKDKCIIINDILENNFFISKKNKDIVIEEFIRVLNIDNTEAIKIYDTAIEIIKYQLKDKLKHPFKNLN